jgi:hypothetical protein
VPHPPPRSPLPAKRIYCGIDTSDAYHRSSDDAERPIYRENRMLGGQSIGNIRLWTKRPLITAVSISFSIEWTSKYSDPYINCYPKVMRKGAPNCWESGKPWIIPLNDIFPYVPCIVLPNNCHRYCSFGGTISIQDHYDP